MPTPVMGRCCPETWRQSCVQRGEDEADEWATGARGGLWGQSLAGGRSLDSVEANEGSK